MTGKIKWIPYTKKTRGNVTVEGAGHKLVHKTDKHGEVHSFYRDGDNDKVRLFNGEAYFIRAWYKTKSEATARAASIRAKGALARIVKSGSSYGVYARVK